MIRRLFTEILCHSHFVLARQFLTTFLEKSLYLNYLTPLPQIARYSIIPLLSLHIKLTLIPSCCFTTKQWAVLTLGQFLLHLFRRLRHLNTGRRRRRQKPFLTSYTRRPYIRGLGHRQCTETRHRAYPNCYHTLLNRKKSRHQFSNRPKHYQKPLTLKIF